MLHALTLVSRYLCRRNIGDIHHVSRYLCRFNIGDIHHQQIMANGRHEGGANRGWCHQKIVGGQDKRDTNRSQCDVHALTLVSRYLCRRNVGDIHRQRTMVTGRHEG